MQIKPKPVSRTKDVLQPITVINRDLDVLPYIQTMRLSLPHLCWIAEKMPKAHTIAMFIAHHSVPNVNNLSIKQSTIAHSCSCTEATVSKAIKFLLDHQVIRKRVGLNETYFELNISYLSKGLSSNSCYYDPQQVYTSHPNEILPDNTFNTEEFLDYYNKFMGINTVTISYGELKPLDNQANQEK